MMFASEAKHIANLALAERLPLMAWGGWFTELGGLMAYSADYATLVRRLAIYVDKILKGLEFLVRLFQHNMQYFSTQHAIFKKINFNTICCFKMGGLETPVKGVLPGNLPIEQLAHSEVTLNLRTARTLGLTIPSELLARTDKVIE